MNYNFLENLLLVKYIISVATTSNAQVFSKVKIVEKKLTYLFIFTILQSSLSKMFNKVAFMKCFHVPERKVKIKIYIHIHIFILSRIWMFRVEVMYRTFKKYVLRNKYRTFKKYPFRNILHKYI